MASRLLVPISVLLLSFSIQAFADEESCQRISNHLQAPFSRIHDLLFSVTNDYLFRRNRIHAARQIKMQEQKEELVRKWLENLLAPRHYENYASLDAIGYRSVIPDGKTASIIDRLDRYNNSHNEDELRKNGPSNFEASSNTFSMSRIKKIADKVDKLKAGICTTLAISAYSLLEGPINQFPGKLKLKLLSSKNPNSPATGHSYLSVTNLATGDVFYIDPWAQAMGHETAVFTERTFPFSVKTAKEIPVTEEELTAAELSTELFRQLKRVK